MKTKRFLAVCLAALIALSCCACAARTEPEPEPETAAQVVEKMQTTLAQTPCTEAQLVMELAMTLDDGAGGSLAASAKTTSNVRVSLEPVSGYTTAATELDIGGERSQSVTENYSILEDGALVTYLHSDGVWMKLSTGQTPEELARAASAVSVDVSNAAIDESVTEYEGKQAICLTGPIGGEALLAALDGMLEGLRQQVGEADTAGALDGSALSCDVRLYLDKSSYLPLAEELTFSGVSEALAPLYAQADVSRCTASAVFLSYEAQEETTLPEGAKDRAEKWMRLLSDEPDNGDGSFTIREGAALIDITAPEGFALADKGYDHVSFKREDNREIHYTAVHGTEEYLVSKIDQQLARYGDLPESVSREELTLDGEALSFAAQIVGVVWSSYEEGRMYAWAELGRSEEANYYIFIEVVDGCNDGLGNIKSADVTPEEFMAYLNAAVPSDLLDE